MAKFSELPIELLSDLFQFIVKPHHLAVLCLVNKSFYAFAVPRLYERVSVYPWHKEGKIKVAQFFKTLAQCPDLARYVRRLEIREFPKALTSGENEHLVDHCVKGIPNCVNLQKCTWTRDGSVTTEILVALRKCPGLQDLEINGHHEHNYDPSILPRFDKLRRISLIMPSATVTNLLLPWIREISTTLRDLTLICKSTTIVNDSRLEELAPYLSHLEKFNLVGCPRVSHIGIWSVVSMNEIGIEDLALEGLSPNFDMAELTAHCRRRQALSRLRSITLTVQLHKDVFQWLQDVLNLISSSPLESFQIYTPGGLIGPMMDERFCLDLVRAHGSHLRRFSVHRMPASIEAIDRICSNCPKLEQLFLVISRRTMLSLGEILAKAPSLRSVHVNFPLDTGEGVTLATMQADALSILRQAGPSIVQIGCNTRVWQVARTVHVGEDGDSSTDIQLLPYESPDIPEQFMVMRA